MGGENEIFNSQIETILLDWVTSLMTKTEKIVEDHWDKIEEVAKRLIEKEIVEEEELNQIINKGKYDIF